MAKVIVIDRDLKRGSSTVRILKANGYEPRLMKSSGPTLKEVDLEWPDVVLLADSPAASSFKVIYRGRGDSPLSKNDTYFFLELTRYLIRQITVDFPFPVR